MKFKVLSELQYEVRMPTTFIFNIQVSPGASQTILEENLSTDPSRPGRLKRYENLSTEPSRPERPPGGPTAPSRPERPPGGPRHRTKRSNVTGVLGGLTQLEEAEYLRTKKSGKVAGFF